MASEIIGLFTNPQQYLAAQDASMQQQFARNAQLAPLQRASMLYQQAGYQAGQGIGGALGGVDPQLEMISRRNALLSKLDQNDPESFMKVAQVAAQIGDNEFAMAIANAGRKAQSEMALTTQRTAEKMTNEQRNALAYASQFGTPDSQAFKDAYKERFDQLTLKAGQAKTPDAIQIAQRVAQIKSQLSPDSGVILPPNVRAGLEAELRNLEKQDKSNIIDVGVAEKTREVVYFDKDADQQFVMKPSPTDPTKLVRSPYSGGIDKTTAKVSASSTSQQESEFSKDLGKADAERVKNAMTLRENSISALTTLQGLSKLDEKGLISGSFATGRVGAANILATVGLISEKDAGVLANSQNYQKISGDLVLATLGGKLGSGFSNEDRKFILGLVPQLETNAQARRQLIDFMVKKNNSIVEETTRLENYARDNKSLKGYAPKIPVINLGGGVNKPVSQMTREELLNEKARLQSK
jgi:hypothetical protein